MARRLADRCVARNFDQVVVDFVVVRDDFSGVHRMSCLQPWVELLLRVGIAVGEDVFGRGRLGHPRGTRIRRVLVDVVAQEDNVEVFVLGDGPVRST